MKTKVILILCFVAVSAQQTTLINFLPTNNTSTEAPSRTDVRANLLKMESDLKNGVKSLLKMAMPMMMESMESLNISSGCMRNILQFLDGLRNLKPWAVSLVDSSGKSFDGLMTGSTTSLGVYDQCLDTVATSSRSKDKGKQLFRGQYCVAEFKPILPPPKRSYLLNDVMDEVNDLVNTDTMAGQLARHMHMFYYVHMNVGVCVPSGCKREDIQEIANSVGTKLNLESNVEYCEVKEKTKLNTNLIAVIFISAVFLLLVFVGTCLDSYSRCKKVTFNGTPIRVLLAFSCLRNFERLCNTQNQEESLTCLFGIRTLSIFWIVLGHTYMIMNYGFLQGGIKAIDIVKAFAFQIIPSGNLAVETFFFMGGMVLSYWTVIQVKIQKKPFSVIHYVLYRLFRLVPTYFFVFYLLLSHPQVTSGPLYRQTMKAFVGDCDNTWWHTLLFINNLGPFEKMCMRHLWYVAADFQLYLAALVVLIPLFKWPRVGLTLGFMAFLSSMIHAGVLTYLNNWAGVFLMSLDQEQTYSQQTFYISPFPHAAAYALGIIIGYVLATKKDIKIPRVLQIAGWCIALTFTSIAVFTSQKWNAGIMPSVLENALVAATFRPIFALGVGWVVLCCCTGHGGIVNYLLSLKAWIVLGRLSFLVYLIHPSITLAYVASLRTNVQAAHFIGVWMAIGHLVVSYLIALIVNMVIEAPFMTLQKMIFEKNKSNTTNETAENLKTNSQINCDEKCYVIPGKNVELISYDKQNGLSKNI